MENKENYENILPIEVNQRSINRMLIGAFSFSWVLWQIQYFIVEDWTFSQFLAWFLFLLIPIRLQLGVLLYKGLVFKDNKLYKAKLLGKFIYSKKEIQTKGASDVVILRYKVSTVPNWKYTKQGLINFTHIYEVHFLNERHSNRNCILYFDEENNARVAAEFIERHSNLFYNEL